jgi:hypothetical protein
MASSVSSERAFSSAGITISKRRNRLKPDIVEALQFLKCLYRRDLLFREEPSTELEVGIEREDLQNSAGTRNPGEAGWDLLITDLAGDEDYADHDDEDVFVQEIM